MSNNPNELYYKYFRDGELVNEQGLHPWDRFPEETHAYYTYFNLYLDLGFDRTIRKVKDEYDGLPTYEYLTKIGREMCWKKRAHARDTYMLQARTEAMQKEYNEFVSKKIKSKTTLSQMIDKLAFDIYQDPHMSKEDKIRALKGATVADSTNDSVLSNYVGTPSERIHITGGMTTENVTKLNFDEEEEGLIAELAKQLARGGGEAPKDPSEYITKRTRKT